eukprot:TRINITY_DN22015_c0_g1_i1.p1 TRINITY_DN22015_c0_g1~~TRINITY_DN22015_c0_g1_i1.p1  ORF type:complete len:298 (-),score=59.71 TRINITY_DN22015_c0_g1_i1:339-1208(-)
MSLEEFKKETPSSLLYFDLDVVLEQSTDRIIGAPMTEEVDIEATTPSHDSDMIGEFATLTKLTTDHIDDLYDSSCVNEQQLTIFSYKGTGPHPSKEDFTATISDHILMGEDKQQPTLFFAVIVEGKAVGEFAFLRIDNVNRSIEIGHLWVDPRIQGTKVATECFYLMASIAFNSGYSRLEWKCDNLNVWSKSAALRLGHTFEGVFRRHRKFKGRFRDTAWFSILDDQWASNVAPKIERWLYELDCDENGRPVESLGEMMGVDQQIREMKERWGMIQKVKLDERESQMGS